MRHFDYLSDQERDRLFFRHPQRFGADDDLTVQAVGLGATLYSPATRPNLGTDIATLAGRGVLSLVVCLEDAVADSDVGWAEHNAVAQLRSYAEAHATGKWGDRDSRPQLFVRVRTPEQIPQIADGLGEHIDVLTGFVLPKFAEDTGEAFLAAIALAALDSAVPGKNLLAMPVLESPEMIYQESRIGALLGVRDLLDKYRSSVLAVRIGATDFSSTYGLRRSQDMSVYDVRVVADVIADVVNVFGREDGPAYVVTGPVWEYYSATERMFKPQLRSSPFIAHAERPLRAEIMAKDLDGLLREVALDKVNGLTGKTVIHPSHVAAVHALSTVTHEEYSDAVDVLGTDALGGVRASAYRNKMNESKPHTAWARRMMVRAHVFGVAHRTISFVDLLGASLHR